MRCEVVLNMRLRALRKLEEFQLRKEFDELTEEKADKEKLLEDEKRLLETLAIEVRDLKKEFKALPALGKRRTKLGAAPSDIDIPLEATIEKEPITIICSQKGWVRAVRGHSADTKELKFKDGDNLAFAQQGETTDKILFLGSNGRFYTILADKLPRGRGHGEPIRLMIDLPNDEDVIAMMIYRPDERVLLASDDGRGFITITDDLVAQTRNGRQVINVSQDSKACICVKVAGDSVAVVGTNRKLLIFPIEELPQMSKGKGVILQKYKDGKLADAKTFEYADGLSWHLKGGRQRTETELLAWKGKRASAGRMPPTGFPKPPKFT